jgi:ABC-2 type transport system ATP-binding protein
VLTVQGLTRRYGDFVAVDDIDLEVRPGEILAFLGSNGAGKTTTIKMIVGLLRPTSGHVEVRGQDVWKSGSTARRTLGYVPDVPLLHEGLTARQFLWLIGGLYELPHAIVRARTEELLRFLAMEPHADGLIREFSLGMKRKMAIAAALIHSPELLLLDEVTNGLDPRAARDIKDYIAETARRGTGVLLTTHILDVAEEIADRIAIIDRGRIRALGTLQQLREQLGLPDGRLEEIFLRVTGNQAAVER